MSFVKELKKKIHINMHVIKANINAAPHDIQPPITVIRSNQNNEYGFTVDIMDSDGKTVAARIVYRPTTPLSCGARVWIETNNPLHINQSVSEIINTVPDNISCDFTKGN